jgi:hypothetical protein
MGVFPLCCEQGHSAGCGRDSLRLPSFYFGPSCVVLGRRVDAQRVVIDI